MGKKIIIKGIELLHKDVEMIAEKLVDGGIKKILLKNAETLVLAMKANAPQRTGQLKESIRIFADEKYQLSVIVAPDFKANDREKLTGHALLAMMEYGANSAVAGMISKKSKDNKRTNERGYWHAKIDGQWVTLKERAPIPATSFIRKTLDETQKKVAKQTGDELLNEIKILAKTTKTLG